MKIWGLNERSSDDGAGAATKPQNHRSAGKLPSRTRWKLSVALLLVSLLVVFVGTLHKAQTSVFPASPQVADRSLPERFSSTPRQVPLPVNKLLSRSHKVSGATATKMAATTLSLPLFFEANRGQADSRVQFLARSGGYTLFVTPTETVFAEARNTSTRGSLGNARTSKLNDSPPALLRMRLLNGNPSPLLSGANKLPGKVNYLIGKNPKDWHVGVPIYAEVHSAEVYPGIDLLFHGNQNLLEYDFRVSPGADPERIQFQVTGAQKLQIDENGDLVLRTAKTEFRMHKPLMYQEVGQDRRPVEGGGFSLKNGNLVAFNVPAYDKNLPLIIDPSILFASFLGGTGEELPIGEDLDTTTANAPKLYVAGLTSDLATFAESSTTIGTSPGAQDYTFVAEIDPTMMGAASLDYLTFIGGSVIFSGDTGACQNEGNYMTLDFSGGAGAVEPVIVGQTNCQDFPVTSGGPTASTEDLFLTRLTSSGAGLDNSIFFGGNGIEGLANGWNASIAVNSVGSVALVGATTSTNLPTTTGAYSASINNGTSGIFNDCFVVEFNRSFSIQYLTYLNVGTGTTTSTAASCGVRAIDAAGKIYAGGRTFSATAFNLANAGTGANGFQPTFAGTAGTNENGFLVVLDPSQTGLNQLFYSTYLGGGGPTDIQDADVDISSGLVVVSGTTFANSTSAAPDIPLANAYQSTNTAPNGSAFVTLFDSTKTGAASLVASTYFGGSAGGGSNQGNAVAFDRQSGNPPTLRVVVGGQTTASNFPTLNPLQTSLVGSQNAFLSVFSVPNSGITYPMTLLFSTYIGGGVTASGQSEALRAVITDPNHNIYALGRSPSTNFFGNTTQPTTVNGFQTTCASCGETPPASDLVIFEVPPQGGASVPDLTITKTHSGNFAQGQTGAQYTIMVTNSGAGATTGVVKVVDTLPLGLTATGMSGTGWTCTIGTLTCTRNDSLVAGASYPAITLTVNVSTPAPPTMTNTAVVSGGNEINTSNDTASDVTTITFPLTVTLSGAGSGRVTDNLGLISCVETAGVVSGTCSANYPGGTLVTLTAAATAGSIFYGWSNACSGAAPCALTINSTQAVTGNFTLAVASQCAAGDTTWIGGASGNWSNAANWNTGVVPNNGVHVCINNAQSPVSAVTLDVSPTIGGLTIDPGNSLTMNNGTSLAVSGTISNSGQIIVNATTGNTYLKINGAVTLSGGGSVVLNQSGAGQPIIYCNTNGCSLSNVDNLVQGAGWIGQNGLAFANQAAGTVSATNASFPLLINAGSATNLGILQAAASGTLQIFTTIVNQGGTIKTASATATVQVTNSASIQGGTLDNTAGGSMGTTPGNTAVLDGTSQGQVTVAGVYLTPNGSNTILAGTINNTGTLQLTSSGSNTYLKINNAVTLTGAGTVFLNQAAAGGQPIIYCNTNGCSLTNSNNLIQGGGWIGQNGLAVTNQASGTVSATNASFPLQISAASFVNQNLIQAAGSATLQILSTIQNQVGTIKTVSGTASIQSSASIQGGTVDNSTGGTLGTTPGSTGELDGATLGPLAVAGIYLTPNGSSTILAGTINNTGTLQLTSSGSNTYLKINNAVTLAGGGSVFLNQTAAGGQPIIYCNTNGCSLTSANNIQGGGWIGQNGLAVTNQASGTVSATNASFPLQISAASFVNQGVIQANGSATLQILSTIQNQVGTIKTVSAAAVVQSSASIQGGTIDNSIGGTLGTTPGSTGELDGITLGTLTVAGIYLTPNGSSTILAGIINNTGTLQLTSSGSNTYLKINNTVTLTGGGSVFLNQTAGTGQPIIYCNTNGCSLINSNNLIQGGGWIGQNGLAVTNQASGTVSATNASFPLQINAGSATNLGTMQAAGSGTLQIFTTVLNQGATIKTAAATATVQVTNSATIQGGTLDNTAGGSMGTAPGNTAVLDGTSDGQLTTAGIYQTPNGTSTILAGTINNIGTLQVISSGSNTYLKINNAVTLTGSGTVFLNLAAAGGQPIIYCNTNGCVLTNSSNSIQGAGIIGQNGLAVVNAVGGTIWGNSSNPLALSTASISNQGLLEIDGAPNPGAVTANNYNQTSTGTLEIAIGGTTAVTQYSQLQNSGTATLAGVLDVGFLNGFQPSLGEAFTALTSSGAISGQFSTINSPNLPSGTGWNATYNSTSVVLTVVAGATLQSIAVTPVSPTIAQGSTQQFTATGTYSDGSQQNITSQVTWNSATTTVATISAAGLATSVGTGTSNITASLGSVTSPIDLLTVTAATVPVLQSINVTPENPTVAAGQTQQFTATGTFSDGSMQNLAGSVSWLSSNTSLATIDPASGLASAIEQGGPVTITATSTTNGAIFGTTSLSVAPPVGLTLTGSLNMARALATGTLLTNGQVLVVGGKGASADLGSAELYNPTTGMFTATGSLNFPRTAPTATLLPNGNVLIAGGYTSTGSSTTPVATAEIYNPATGQFTTTGSFNTPRRDNTATLLTNGTVLFTGGYDPSNSILSSAEIFDPGTGTFTTISSMTAARLYHTATLLNNGTVLIAGGIATTGTLDSAEIYNPATGTFTATGNLVSSRYEHTATLLDDGTVLMAGGLSLTLSPTVTYTPVLAAELYNPATGSFVATGSNMTVGRSYDSANLLNNGTVLFAGGISYNSDGTYISLPSAEIYDPVAKTFTATGSLNTQRAGQAAVLLLDGNVLEAGGAIVELDSTTTTATTTGLSSAELYTPTTLTQPGLSSITVTPATPSIPAGTSQKFTATGTFTGGGQQTLASVTWSSSSPSNVTITSDATNSGSAFAVVSGSSTITACEGSVCGSTSATTTATLQSIAITSASPSVANGLTVQLTATGTYSDGSQQNISSLVTWSSTTAGIVNISATGLATGVGVGSTSITASLNGVTSPSITLTVTPATLQSIAVTPANPSIPKGLTQQFTATGIYSDGSMTDLTSQVTWNSSTTTVATISASGLATGVAAGMTNITASLNGVTSPATVLTVTAAALVSISVTPEDPTAAAGQTVQFTATGTFTDGSTGPTGVTWASSNTTLATINSTGLASATQQGGPITITATSSVNVAIFGTATLNVAPAIGFVLTGSLDTGHSGPTSTLLTNGMVLVAGGLDPSLNVLATAVLYNSGGGAFAFTGSMTTPRFGQTATLLPNGKVLLAGGAPALNSSNGQPVSELASAELYDPSTGIFTAVGNMSTARLFATATLLPNGKVLVAGGRSSIGLNTAEIFDPATNTFTTTGTMTTARFDHVALALNNGTVLLAGGIATVGSGVALSNAEIYNPASGTFTATNSMTAARYVPTATLLDDGTVLITGGFTGSGASLNSAELYNPSNQTFTATGSMSAARALHTATLLNNGTVLCAGGDVYNADGTFLPLPSAEIYDPVAQTFTLTGSLNDAREDQTATLLTNGLVLVAGGDNQQFDGINFTGGALASAELYEPTTYTQPGLTSIALTPAGSSITQGSFQKFAATGTFTGGGQQTLASVIWSSSNPSVVTITNDVTDSGVAFAQAAGSVFITACEGSVCGSTSATATSSATLQSIALSPASPSIAAGFTQQFTATGTYSDGSQQNITSQVTWSSGTISVATINAAGLATGVGVGTSNITASLSGVTSSADVLTVTSATLQTIAITPANPSVPKGQTVQLTATGVFSDESMVDLTSQVAWNSATTTVATISATGLATGMNTGTSVITASLNGITSSNDTLTVTAPVLVSITVLPPNTTLSVGSIQQYIAIGTFSDGSTQDLGANVTWTSSNTTFASISSTGSATGVSPGGPVTITATSTANTAVSGTAQLTVSGNAPFAYVGDIISANCCMDVINTFTNQIVKTIPITNINEPIGITPDQSRIYVADNVDNLVDVIDTTTNTLMTTIPIGVDPTSVAITPDGKYGYVADFGDNNLNVFSVATNAATASIPIGFPASAASITPDGAWVYVASDADGRVAVVNTATNTLSSTFTLTAPAGSPAPGCAAVPVFNPASTLGYFMQSPCTLSSTSPGTVNVLSIPSNTVVATIEVGLFPFQQVLTPDGSHLYVANLVSNTVSVIDTATNTVSATIQVARGPQSIAMSPDGTKVYVAETPAATVSVIDTSTNTVTANIATTVPFGIVIASPPPASTATTTLTLTPPNLVFNSQPLGTTSVSQTISVQNPGTSPVTLTNVSLTGPNTGDFPLTNNCPAPPATLGAGSSCNLQVSFAPTAIGQRTALVSITNNNGTGSYTQNAPLSGTGISLSSIAVTPVSPSILQGSTQPFTATGTYNDGSTANITSQVAWASATMSVATINSAGVATGVGPGTSNITASLSGVTSPADVLTVAPGVAGAGVTPSTLTYPTQVIGTPGTAQPVTVYSTGTGPLTISSITFSGTNPTEYTETDNCPIYPATLPAGMFCTIQVSFAPLAVGTRTANLVVTDNDSNIPGSQQSVSLTGTATAPAPTTTTVQLPFTPGTNVSQVAIVNCPSGTSPCTDPNAHSMKILFNQVNTPFVMTVTAYEVPLSQANGVCEAGNNETNDFDCRFTQYFAIQTEANGDVIVPQCIPYSNGNCVFYRITNAPNIDQYSGPVFENIAWNNTAFVPPSFYQANNPQAYDDPDYPPYDVNHQFALDVTDYFNPVAQVGTDPTITLHTTRFSDFTVAWPGSLPSPAYTFTFQPPLNGTPSVMQGATIPVAFSLTQSGTPITNATTAPNIVSLGLINAQGIRQPAYAPNGTAAAFVYNPTAQLYQLTLATQNLVPGTYTLLVNSNLFTQQTATFTITPVPLQILTTSPLPSGAEGVLYAQAFTAIGGTAPYTWTVTSGSLPNGLTLSTAGFLNGTPAVTGTFTFTVQVTDSAQNTQSSVYSLTINLPIAGAGVSPSTLTYASQVIGTTSAAQTVTVNSTGTGPLTLSSIAFSGANPSEYSEIDNCPISPVYLPAGTSCTIQVSFAPLAVGTRTANLVVTDNDSNIPGSQQSVSLTGTATAPAPTVTTFQLPFTPGTNVSQVAVVNCPSGTSPCTDPNAHSMKFLFTQVNTPFVLTVTTTEVPISQANGVCLAGNNSTNDFDCRFTEYFAIQTEANGDIIVPECIPYSNGNCVFYTVSNSPATTAYSGPIFENISWNNTAFVPPSFYQVNNPQAYDAPSYPPYNVNNQFALDVTDYFNPVAQVGTDPTITLHTTRFSDFTVAWPGSLPSPAYTFTFQPPLNGTPSVMQGATIPVAFSLTQNGTPITNATTAPNIVSMGLINAQGIRQPAYAPNGTAATFVYNSTAQLYQLTLATQNLVPGTYTLFVDSNLFTQQTATFTITPVPLQILTTSPLPSGAEGVLYPLAFTAIGGTAPYTWAVTSGSLPNGLTLSTAGFLDGTPTVTGTFTFTLQVTDSAQNTQSNTYSLTIGPPVLVSIAVTPANASIARGTTQQFTATGTYSDNSMKNLIDLVIWTSSASSIASISATGLATGVNAGGPVTITAALGNISGSTQLTVTASIGEPHLATELAASGWQNGNFFVEIQITNLGAGPALNVTIDRLAFKILEGSGEVYPNNAISLRLPAKLGTLHAGASTKVKFYLEVSTGVQQFRMTEISTYTDAAARPFDISPSQIITYCSPHQSCGKP